MTTTATTTMRRRHYNASSHAMMLDSEVVANESSRRKKTANSFKVWLRRFLKHSRVVHPIISTVFGVGVVVMVCLRFQHQHQHLSTPLSQPPIQASNRTFEERVDHIQNVVNQGRHFVPLKPLPYDVFNCPLEPPDDYPMEFPILDVLHHWPVDETNLDYTHEIHQGLCVFDFALSENTTALKEQITMYRNAELPFVVRNDPSVLQTAERWNDGQHLHQLLQGRHYRGHVSPNNHFLFFKITKGYTDVPPGFQGPTKVQSFTFDEWLQVANTSEPVGLDEQHVYLRLDGCLNKDQKCLSNPFTSKKKKNNFDHANFWFDELNFFHPHKPESELYVVDTSKQQGIQCWFGMQGVVSENHFDFDRNFVTVLGGARRYILGHPKHCTDWNLFAMHHPMERHTKVDYVHPDLEKFPSFEKVQVNEVVMQAGDVLYMPTFWFHSIMSLSLNFQCNTRSGYTTHYEHHIRKCGFNFQPIV